MGDSSAQPEDDLRPEYDLDKLRRVPDRAYIGFMHEHKVRWDQLSQEGWIFDRPRRQNWEVGLQMTRGDVSAVFYVRPGEKTTRAIHTFFLESAERFASGGTREWGDV